MEGMTPYVDFTDSKGPLLWIIYGVGYLISGQDYIGVWILEVLYYSVVSYFAYRIAILLLNEKRWAFLTAALVRIPMLCWLDDDIHAEQWCLLSLMYLLYNLTCSCLNGNNKLSTKSAIWCGVAVGIAVFIKWSVGLAYMILLCIIPLCGVFGSRSRSLVVITLKTYLLEMLGVFSVCLVVSLLMLSLGGLYGMFDEYFFATYGTIQGGTKSYQMSLLSEWCLTAKHLIFSPRCWALIFVACTLPLFRKHRKKVWLIFISGVVLIMFFNIHDMRYYQMALASYAVFFFVFIAQIATLYYGKLTSRSFGIIMCAVIFFEIYHCALMNRNMMLKFPAYPDIMAIEESISNESDNPTILCYRCNYSGIGISSRVSPSTLYWSNQAGANQDMLNHQDSVLMKRKADVVTVVADVESGNPNIQKVEDAGYKKIGEYEDALFKKVHVYIRE